MGKGSKKRSTPQSIQNGRNYQALPQGDALD